MAELTPTDWVYSVAECVTGVLAVLSNVLVLVAIYCTRSLRTVTNCFIASLALADVIVGVTIPPSVILSYFGLPHDFAGCVLLNSVVVLITNISIINLMAVALERFLAISQPFLYQRVMTKRRAIAVVSVTWVIAILLGLVPTMGWNLGEENFDGNCSFTKVISMDYMVYMIFFGVNIPPLVIMFCVYTYIFYIIRKLNKLVASQMTILSQENRTTARRQKREVRGAQSLAYVIILFAVCWLPIHILNCITLFAPEKSPPFQFLLFTIVLSHANSFMNPIVYAFSNTQFQRAFVRILCCREAKVSYTTESSGAAAAGSAPTPYCKTPSNQPASVPGKSSNGLVSNFVTQNSPQTNTQDTVRTVSYGVFNKAYDNDSGASEEVQSRNSLESVRSPDSKTVKWSDAQSNSSQPDVNRDDITYLQMGKPTNQSTNGHIREDNKGRISGGDTPCTDIRSVGAAWATATSQSLMSREVCQASREPSPAPEEIPVTSSKVLTNSNIVPHVHASDDAIQEMVLEEYTAGEEACSSPPDASLAFTSQADFAHKIKPSNAGRGSDTHGSTVSLRLQDTADNDSLFGSRQFVSIRL